MTSYQKGIHLAKRSHGVFYTALAKGPSVPASQSSLLDLVTPNILTESVSLDGGLVPRGQLAVQRGPQVPSCRLNSSHPSGVDLCCGCGLCQWNGILRAVERGCSRASHKILTTHPAGELHTVNGSSIRAAPLRTRPQGQESDQINLYHFHPERHADARHFYTPENHLPNRVVVQ